MIKTNIEGLRDPFLLVDNGIYYLYGTEIVDDWDNTNWACYINGSGKLCGEWKKTEHLIYEKPSLAEKQFWAPEVHKYKDAYYMFCTYYSRLTKRRGCTILKSISPAGPFTEISNGHVTPQEIDAIDATFYLDEDAQPWIIYVHEWSCTDDNIGRMCIAKLSNDLTHIISKPIEIFRADSPSWTNEKVTDGCFLRKLASGELIMLWSNFQQNNYCIGIARSTNGKIDGNWVHDDVLIYKKGMVDNYDGGHGMVFTDTDGQLYLCLHSPNEPCDECKERTIFLPVKEQNGTLII